MHDARRQGAAVGALAAILAITAAWWTLALWPRSEEHTSELQSH